MKKIYLSIIMILASVFVTVQAQTQLFNVGDKAPGFSAITHTGEQVELQKLLQKGPVVVLFYRGYWCPYCSKQLSQLQDSLSLFTSKGATIVAITPETYESVDKTIEKTKAGFTIISDTLNTIMKTYGVNFVVDDKTVEKYKTFNINLTQANGNNENVLPVPGMFVIGKDGKFKYVYFNTDYRKRPYVKDLVPYL
jgi:peroxiredoxin